MKIPCPHCQAVFGVHPARLDEPVTCPRCRAAVRLPGQVSPDPAPPSRPRRRSWFKTIVFLVLAVMLLRWGFGMGWEAAGNHLGESGLAEPTRAAPQPKQGPSRRAKRTATDLVEYLRAAGLPCTAVAGSSVFAPSKATALMEVEGEGWHAALYQFESDADAEALTRLERKSDRPVYRNHNLVLRVIEGEDTILPAFKKF